MYSVQLNNDAGWELRALQEFRTFEDVLRVDGIGLRADGRFDQVMVHFPNPMLAAQFQAAAARSLAKFTR